MFTRKICSTSKCFYCGCEMCQNYLPTKGGYEICCGCAYATNLYATSLCPYCNYNDCISKTNTTSIDI